MLACRDPFNHRSYVAEAAASLRVANLAGTLIGLDTCGDALDCAAMTRLREFGSDRGGGMPEAIAHQDIV